jgi:hypothetical protein
METIHRGKNRAENRILGKEKTNKKHKKTS